MPRVNIGFDLMVKHAISNTLLTQKKRINDSIFCMYFKGLEGKMDKSNEFIIWIRKAAFG